MPLFDPRPDVPRATRAVHDARATRTDLGVGGANASFDLGVWNAR